LNPADEAKKAYNFSNLESFLKIYYEGAKVLLKEKDFFELTWAYALKCKEDNIVHTEIFFDPQTHTNRGISFDIIINGIYKALKKAEKEFDSGPLQEKPLDEREQEDQDTTDIWMYAIALVIVFVIIRVAFKIIKKRMKPKKD